MAKQYYNAEEARQKLRTDDNGLRALVRQGKLREFRDAGKLTYRVEEVDALAAEMAGGPGGSGELTLEPLDEGPASESGSMAALLSLDDSGTEKPSAKTGTGPSAKTGPAGKSGPAGKTGTGSAAKSGESDIALSGSDVLSLEEVDKETVEGMRKDDTVITNVGISVFDDDDLEIAADPMAKTITTGAAEHLGLDGSGGGSGLLDLTRESDDTSLGADVLSDIELTDETAQTVEAEPSGTEAAPAEAEEEMPTPEAVPVVAQRVAVVPVTYLADPTVPILAGLLVAGMLVLAVAGSVTASMMLDVWPGYLAMLYDNLLIFTLASVLLGGLCALIGWLIGRPPTPRREKPAKPEKPKKQKAAPAGATPR